MWGRPLLGRWVGFSEMRKVDDRVSGAKKPVPVSCLLRVGGGCLRGAEGHERSRGLGADGGGGLVGAGTSKVAKEAASETEGGGLRGKGGWLGEGDVCGTWLGQGGVCGTWLG